jgi:ParB-like chromosome segregation protein Spo0J
MMSAKQSKFPLIKTAQVADLIPYARNSRTHSDEQITQIAASIKEFGFLNPVIVDGENGIIAGHGRVMAAKKLGMTELPAVEASHLTDAQRRAYIIADNKLALNAGWDDEMLRVEFDELGAMGFDLELTGFDVEELAELFDSDKSEETIKKENLLPQAMQLQPAKEYAVIVCSNEEDWERLKVALSLTPVRRGGYKKESPFDAVGTQRVVKAEDVLLILEGAINANSSAQ